MKIKTYLVALTVLLALGVGALKAADDLLVTTWNDRDVKRYDGLTGAFEGVFVAPQASPPGPLLYGSDANLYASAHAEDEIRLFDGQTGEYLRPFVSAGSGGLDGPAGLTFGPGGDLYVVSNHTKKVLRYDGTTGDSEGEFIPYVPAPISLEFSGEYLYVTCGNPTNEIRRYDAETGDFNCVFVTSGLGGLTHPFDLAFGPDANLYVASQETDQVLKYSGVDGSYLGVFMGPECGLDGPAGIEFGSDGYLYVVGGFSNNILRSNGTVCEVFATVETPVWITFAPALVTVYLKDDGGVGLQGEQIAVQPAYGGSWGSQYSGVTGPGGAFSISDMPEGYTKIRMTFNQASVEQTVAELVASAYTWTAVPLTIQFQDDAGGPLAGGKVEQGGSTWVHHGYTDAAGQLALHVFAQRQYKFRVGYDYTSQTKWFEVPGPGGHTEVFQTVAATVTVVDFQGDGLPGVKVDQGGASWVHHGYTDENGELALQLFGDQDYKFRVSGDIVSNSSQTAWFAVPGPIAFQAGYVVSAGTAVKASIGGKWVLYSAPGMHILPGTYKFIFAAPTPSPQWVTVLAGEVTDIP